MLLTAESFCSLCWRNAKSRLTKKESSNLFEEENIMRVYMEADYDGMSRRAANLISAEVIRKPDCVLGLATGSTPVGTYK